jgi:hypothetical protein
MIGTMTVALLALQAPRWPRSTLIVWTRTSAVTRLLVCRSNEKALYPGAAGRAVLRAQACV